jgi:hypothetical protein
MGSGGGGSAPSTQTVTQVSQPPEYVEDPAKRYLGRAEGLSQTPFSTYGGERISPLNPAHYAGINAATNLPDMDAARNLAAYTLQGGYLNSNPYLDATFNRAADQVQARMTNATAGNNLTNTGVQQMYGRGLNDLGVGIYGGNYDAERNRQQGMIPYAMQLPQAQAQTLLGAGDVLRDWDQSRINEAIRQFEEQRMYPYQQADVLGRAIGASMGTGGTVTTQQPGYYQPSRTAGMLGGGLVGNYLGNQINSQYGGILGALGGAGLGAYY